MDNSLQALCDALKKILWQLKPQTHELSFIILTGKVNQGKTTLLRQSNFQHVAVDSERVADIYYNQRGVVVELGESWLNQSNNLLQYTLKQLNRCHRAIKITGIILCIDVHELFITEPASLAEQNQAHLYLLQRFGLNLGYRIDLAIVFTKLDALAGFCDFFQSGQTSNFKKPLGFSLHQANDSNKLIHSYNTQFEQLIEKLGQQVIDKLHPVRSSIKRTLIREFPLQLASLRSAIQSLLQKIPLNLFQVQALYFISAEQGGLSVDRLNHKIQHEYALMIRDTHPQSFNHRAYFIDGAITAFQAQTQNHPVPFALFQKYSIGLIASVVVLFGSWLIHHHIKSSHILDDTGKNLQLYESMLVDENIEAPALYYLSLALNSLDKIPASMLSSPSIEKLKSQIHSNNQQHVQSSFIPKVLNSLEQVMMDAAHTPAEQYQALKIYLMLGHTNHFSQVEVLDWFASHWHNEPLEQREKKLTLLKQVFAQPLQPVEINLQAVRDVRNYLNAIPANFLYYTMAKQVFPKETQKIDVEGFALTNVEIPTYFTKAAFPKMMHQLSELGKKYKNENWILARQDLDALQSDLPKAYINEYANWWQNFTKHIQPMHFQNYQQAHLLTQALDRSNAIEQLIHVIQQHTRPDNGAYGSLFNQNISKHFGQLNLISNSAIHDLTHNIMELDAFLNTLSLIQDQGETAFTFTRTRFLSDTISNPLSALHARSQQIPEPVSSWIKQIAEDAWVILLNDSKDYINQQWQHTVFNEYQNVIAHRFPFDDNKGDDVSLRNFERFFAHNGTLQRFINFYLKPYLDTTTAQWQPKEINGYVLPVSKDSLDELIRANVITNMFFLNQNPSSYIEFTLQKINMDPVIAKIQMTFGQQKMVVDQSNNAYARFSWPHSDSKLSLNSIEGEHYELNENGPWSIFKLLHKANILVDEQDSSQLQVIFDLNGYSSHYILKAKSQVNPFIPGILNGFYLKEKIV